MSMLEELFGVDEADEAEALERVIEGVSEDDERRGDDEAVEDRRTVDPTKPKSVRVVKNPRVLLNPARLTGPRGLQALLEHFKDFKFKGKGREQEDLDLVLKKLEHWAHRLYPRFQFHDCLKKIEMLGNKRPVMVTLRKIRSDQLLTDDIVTQRDSSDDDGPAPAPEDDEFDQLLQQQIELARATPLRGPQPFAHTPAAESPAVMPKATSSLSITEEQRLRMQKFRQRAEERRQARMRQSVANTHNEIDSSGDASLINPAKQLVSTVIDRTEVSDNMNVVHITGNTKGIAQENFVPIGLPVSNEDSDATNTFNITDISEGLISGNTKSATDTNDDSDAMDTSNINSNTEEHLLFGNIKSKVNHATDINKDSDAMNAINITDITEGLISGNTKSKETDATATNEDSGATDTINITKISEGLISSNTKSKETDAIDTSNITSNTEGHFIFGNIKSKVSDATNTNEESDARDTRNTTGITEGHFHSDSTKTKECDAIDTIDPTGNTNELAIENSSKTSTLDAAPTTNTTTVETLHQRTHTKVTNISTENEIPGSWDDIEMQDLEKTDYDDNQNDKEINKSVSSSSKKLMQLQYNDSSDDECQITTFNLSVAADLHDMHAFPQDSDEMIGSPTQSSKDEEISEDISIERGNPTVLSGNDEILEYRSKEKLDVQRKRQWNGRNS